MPLFFQPALPLKQQTAMVIWKDCSWHTGWVHREFGAIKPRNSKYKLDRQHVQPLGEKGFRTKSLSFISLLINFSFVTFLDFRTIELAIRIIEHIYTFLKWKPKLCKQYRLTALNILISFYKKPLLFIAYGDIGVLPSGFKDGRDKM